MKIADTISVNPGKTTLGHVDTPASSIFRSPVISSEVSHRSKDLLKIIFPTLGGGTMEYKKYEVPLRTIFSTILIVSGITMLSSIGGIHGMGMAICSLCFGAMLAIGLFTRPVMLGAAVYYCICGALSIRTGAIDLSIFSLMFGCLIFGVIGAGKYSCDSALLNACLKHRKISEIKRKENMMSYKAFHHAKF